MSDTLHTQVIKVNGERYRIELMHDCDPITPREWDNVAHFCFWHGRYNMAQELKQYTSAPELKELRRAHPDAYIYPVYMYDHSNISLSLGRFGCRFDSGLLGFAIVDKSRASDVFGITELTEERAREIVSDELQEYEQYINGEVYAVSIDKIQSVTHKIYALNGELLREYDDVLAETVHICSGLYSTDDIIAEIHAETGANIDDLKKEWSY